MKCEKCQDRGFTERDHGLIRILCNCEKARDVAESMGIPRGDMSEPAPEAVERISVAVIESDIALDKARVAFKAHPELEVRTIHSEGLDNDSISGIEPETRSLANDPDLFIDIGTEPNNKPAGSGSTGKPQQSKEPRTEKKARKGSR